MTAWPYEVLVTVPYEDLVAVDDGEAWQHELAVKLLEAELRQAIGCERTSRDPVGVVGHLHVDLCSDPVVRACCGVAVRDLGLCYAPLEELLDERVASVSAWAATEPARRRMELMSALAHVRRHAVACELPTGMTQWVVPPSLLGNAVPCTNGGLEHFVADGKLIIRAGSAGLRGGDHAPARRFARRSSDEQLLEFGVCAPGNPYDSYVIHDMPAAALAAWKGRYNDDQLCHGDDVLVQQMKVRAAEISAFAACTPGIRTDNVVLLRDADAIGPCWPGIPGPNLCDLNSLVIARWLTVPSPGDMNFNLNYQ